MSHIYPLRQHQEDALHKLRNGSVLWGGVGSGKTKVATHYHRRNEGLRDVYVFTTAKKRDSLDWQEEFADLGVFRAIEGEPQSDPVRKSVVLQERRGILRGGPDAVGGAGQESSAADSTVHRLGEGAEGGRRPTVTVDSWNNIGKYRHIQGAFIVFDEQRLVGSGEWTKVFLELVKTNRWILLSATPGDTWMDYVPLFLAHGFYKNRTEFKHKHVIYVQHPFVKFPKIDRYQDVGRLLKQRNQILVEMKIERHTKRHIVEVPVEYDKVAIDLALKERWNNFEERPIKDVAELFRVMRRIVNSDDSRLYRVAELLQRHPRLIIFYNFNYELEDLRQLVSTLNAGQATGILPGRPSSDLESGVSTEKLLTGRSGSTSWGGSGQSSLEQWKREPKSGSVSSSGIWHPSTSSGSSTTGQLRSLTMSNTTSLVETPRLLVPDSSPRLRPTSLQVAEWNGHKHQEIPDSERWVYLVQYTAGAEGWNCTSTDAMCLYSLNYSWKILEQAYGRIDRLNTLFRDLYYYVLMSTSPVDRAIWRSLGVKKNFNERKFAKMFGV